MILMSLHSLSRLKLTVTQSITNFKNIVTEMRGLDFGIYLSGDNTDRWFK